MLYPHVLLARLISDWWMHRNHVLFVKRPDLTMWRVCVGECMHIVSIASLFNTTSLAQWIEQGYIKPSFTVSGYANSVNLSNWNLDDHTWTPWRLHLRESLVNKLTRRSEILFYFSAVLTLGCSEVISYAGEMSIFAKILRMMGDHQFNMHSVWVAIIWVKRLCCHVLSWNEGRGLAIVRSLTTLELFLNSLIQNLTF